MKKLLKFSSFSSGFTLVELTVVMAIVAILAGAGFTGISRYNRTQKVEIAARDFAGVLQTAKSRAFANVRPNSCTGKLIDWRVFIASGGTSYTLSASCGSLPTPTPIDSPAVILSDVQMTRPIDFVIFPVLKGTAVMGSSSLSSPQQFVFTRQGSSISKTVIVYEDGRIVIQ